MSDGFQSDLLHIKLFNEISTKIGIPYHEIPKCENATLTRQKLSFARVLIRFTPLDALPIMNAVQSHFGGFVSVSL